VLRIAKEVVGKTKISMPKNKEKRWWDEEI